MNRLLRIAAGLLLLATLCSPLAAVPVTDGLVLWLDATDETTLFRDAGFTIPANPGDPIGGWMDKSGEEFFAIQPDENRQPVWNAAAMNGQPSLRFSGFQQDGMAIDEGLYLERPYTVFIVNQYWDEANRGRTLQGVTENWLAGLWWRRMGSFAGDWVAMRNAPVLVPMVVDTVGSLDESFVTINGTDFTTNPLPLGAPGNLGLVSVGLYPGEVSDADISEVVIYDRALSETELSDVRSYLYAKYNVTLIDEIPQNTVRKGSLGLFTGGDPDDGIDLEGDFAYAINVGGRGGLVVGDAAFTDGSLAGLQQGSTPGAMINVANEAPQWGYFADFGDTPNDDNLEIVMESIRWNAYDSQPPMNIELEVETGGSYRLQLLFAEQLWDRGFDIFVEDEKVVEAFNIQLTQGGFYPDNADRAVVYSLDLIAADDILNISLGGVNLNAPDNNPLLQALTLELLPGTALPGDYNDNGELDAEDLDYQAEVFLGIRPESPEYDANGDGSINAADRAYWLSDLKMTWIGDSNFDFQFNTADFVAVLSAGEYETGERAGWAKGDWTGDLVFGTADLVAALAAGGYEKGPYSGGGVAAVPEPSGLVLWLLGAFALIRRRQ